MAKRKQREMFGFESLMDELRKEGDVLAENVTDWFKHSPKRKICRVEVVDGKVYNIKRKGVKKQVNKIIDKIIKDEIKLYNAVVETLLGGE